MQIQNALVQEMTRNQCTKEEIEKTLKTKFGEGAMKSSTLYEKMRLVRCGQDITSKREYHSQRVDTQLVIRIQQVLEEFPFSSVRSIARTLHEPSSTIHRYLVEILHLKYRVTRWLPHQLSDPQMKQRIEDSNALFDIIEKSKHTGYRNLITGDQTWLLYQYHPKGKWCLENEERPEFEGDHITHQKIMITIIWGVWGFFVIDELPQGVSYNSSYFKQNILDVLISKKFQIWPNSNGKKIWLHLDNCKVHSSKQTTTNISQSSFKRAPHPPYSPDIAPSDFYLFGNIKKKLEGAMFNSREELFERLVEILNAITRDERIAVFQELQNRCDFIRNNKGRYFK